MRRESSSLQPDDVCSVDPIQQLASVCQIPATKHLKIVRCGVPRQSQPLFFLTDNFMDYSRGYPIPSESTSRQIISIVNELTDRVSYRPAFVVHAF
jgi:hypothetical protein